MKFYHNYEFTLYIIDSIIINNIQYSNVTYQYNLKVYQVAWVEPCRLATPASRNGPYTTARTLFSVYLSITRRFYLINMLLIFDLIVNFMLLKLLTSYKTTFLFFNNTQISTTTETCILLSILSTFIVIYNDVF